MLASRCRQICSAIRVFGVELRRWVRKQTPGIKAGLLAGFLLLLRWMRPAADLPVRAAWFSAEVTVVIDGDSLELSTGDRIRLAGIDTPETFDKDGLPSHAGETARDWLRERIQSQPVRIRTFGTQQATSIDRFGRTVAWVYDEQGVLINQQIVELGLSKLVTDYGLPNDLDPALRRSEAIARCKKRGVWREGR